MIVMKLSYLVVRWHNLTSFFHSQFDDVKLFCRGVVRVDINLQDVDIDQCSTDGWFAGTHRCNLTTMEVSVPNRQTRHLLCETEV